MFREIVVYLWTVLNISGGGGQGELKMKMDSKMKKNEREMRITKAKKKKYRIPNCLAKVFPSSESTCLSISDIVPLLKLMSHHNKTLQDLSISKEK